MRLTPACVVPPADSHPECEGVAVEGGAANHPQDAADFRPKYKYYEEVKDSRKDRFLILKLRQSPGIRRRQVLGSAEPGESRTDTNTDTAGESLA